MEPARPRGAALPATSVTSRREDRIPFKTFVHLYSSENHTFEVATTLDISCHGARVQTRTFWTPNLSLSVRSIQGNFYSRGRVVYCERQAGSFVVGLEMYYPEGKPRQQSKEQIQS